MTIRENDFKLDIEEGLILPFEEKVLASGLCDVILPMRFAGGHGRRSLMYECSGYTAVSELDLRGIRDIYEVLEKTVLTLAKAQEFLLFPEKIVLSGETVFYHLKHRDVKIAYVPDIEKRSIGSKLKKFIDELASYGDDNAKSYLKRTSSAIAIYNYNLKDTVNHVGEIKREMFLCGIR